jgi:hypothetical protein
MAGPNTVEDVRSSQRGLVSSDPGSVQSWLIRLYIAMHRDRDVCSGSDVKAICIFIHTCISLKGSVVQLE